MIHPQRIHPLNRKPVREGGYVCYWMQSSQRAAANHALEYAVEQGNALGLPVVACFGLWGDYPEANLRHYAFMLEGLAETATALAHRGVPLVVRCGDPPDVAAELARPAAMVVTDQGYLSHQCTWRRRLARAVDCRAVAVETDLVVPVTAVSDKPEYAARTLRPKHQRLWEEFLQPLRPRSLQAEPYDKDLGGIDLDDPNAVLRELPVDRSVGRVNRFRGGLSQARALLQVFLSDFLCDYAEKRNDPSLGIESHMSPYLHFGQISPLEIALAVRDADAPQKSRDAYLEELLIRRELAINFVAFAGSYSGYKAIPSWARASLEKHQSDARAVVYTRGQFEAADTDDPYWNAAMLEMTRTGKMHNYMRMYWGKKVLEWTRSPRTAYRWLLEWNNRYFLDGRDPSSYANVAWIFGRHDRPWKERPIFGTVRYMSAAGLERKFDIDGYVKNVEQMVSSPIQTVRR